MNNAINLSKKLDSNRSNVLVNPVNTINVSVVSSEDRQSNISTATHEHTTHTPPENPYSLNTPPENQYGLKAESYESFERNPPVITDLKVKYPTEADLLITKLESENAALKVIIEMLRSNPLMINHLILADDDKLALLVKLLTNAESVNVDAEDLGSGCGTKTYRKVNAIYVIKNGNTKNLKYDFPEITKALKDLGINTKFVW